MLLAILACVQDDPQKQDTAPDTPKVDDIWTGVAGWDPIVVEVDHDVARPELVSLASGADVPVHALDDPGGVYAYAPDATLAPGQYQIASVEDARMSGPYAWEVEDYGQVDGFDASTLVGRAWTVDEHLEDSWGSGVVAIATAYAGDPVVQVLAVDGDEIEFRIVSTPYGGKERCEVLHATGTLSATGEFRWGVDEIVLNLDPDPVSLHDVSLHWGWSADGATAAGGEAALWLDTRAFGPYLLDPEDTRDPDLEVCDGYARSFGATCFDCAGDGKMTCAQAIVWGGTLHETLEVLGDDLDLCGVDLEQASSACDGFEMPDLSCSGLALPLLGVATIGLRRRRRA